MIKIGFVSACLFFIFSCSKIKENAKYNNYVGEWKIEQVDSICYSSEATIENTFDVSIDGVLSLQSDRIYSAQGFNELESTGKWSLFFHGKKNVLLLKGVRATVVNKKKKSLQLDFSAGENGSLLYVKRYFLVLQ